MQRIHSLFVPLSAAVLAACGILFGAVWFFAPLGLGLFFFDLVRGKSYRGAFWRGLLFGLATGGAGIWWFWNTLPLDWLGLHKATTGVALVFLSWGPVTLMFGLVTAVGTLLLFRLRHLPGAFLVFPFLWALIEEARMWGFSILTWAERGLLGPHFSSTSIGYPLAENSYLLQLAYPGGVFALNIAAAFFAVLVASLLARDFSWRMRPIVAVLVIMLVYPLFLPKTVAFPEPVEVVLGYSNIPVGTVTGDNEFIAFMGDAARETPTASLYVLPEELRLNSPITNEKERRDLYEKWFGDRDVLLLSSLHTPGEPSGKNIVLQYENGHGELVGRYAKRLLMPGGEYMPHAMLAVFRLAPDSALDGYLSNLPLKAAPYTDLVTVPLGEHRVGGLICSDFLSPILNRDLASVGGADILVNSANPSWFHGSGTLYTKTMQISKVHAVQNRSYYLQASNGDSSFAINPQGVVIAESPRTGSGILTVSLR
jgi:apolipoprotein N-acyltransferase